jgi:excisionase family DNA binding protein
MEPTAGRARPDGVAMSKSMEPRPDRTPEVEQDSDVLTVPEAARVLRVPKTTIYKLVRLRKLPAAKLGRHWRIRRRDLDSLFQSPDSASA